MNARLVLSSLVRESRGARGRLVFFTLCLAIGVAAVVGVAGLIGAIEEGMRHQSRGLLAADLRVQSRLPLPPELDGIVAGMPGAASASLRELATMASRPERPERPGNGDGGAANGAVPAAGGRTRLVELKVVEGPYPFYGELGLAPDRPLAELLEPDAVVVAPELMSALRLELGDELSIGGAPFRVAGVVEREPDRIGFSLTLGPRVLMSAAGFERTELLEFGSRVRYKALLHLPSLASEAELDGFEARLRRELPNAEYLRFDHWREAQPTVSRGLSRVESYLGLVALLSLILGGTGVAQIVRAWLAERTRSIAVMRCLGFRPREILVLYLANVSLLALAGCVLGVALGSLLPWVAPRLAPDLLDPELVRPWQPGAAARGLFLGLSIALLFSLPPLSAIWRVPPARVLRAEASPLPPRRAVQWIAGLALLAGAFAAAWVQSEDLERAAVFTGGLAVTGAVLAAGARGAILVCGKLPREGLTPVLRAGLAALARPSAGTIGAVVALGLGTLVVTAMLLVERRLSGALGSALPENAPTTFLVDIQRDQWAGVEAALAESGAEEITGVPVVTARLAEIDGTPVREWSRGRGRRWALTREQRITWMDELPEDNRIVAGELWSDPERPELSVEQDFAKDLGIGLGSRLRFDVQGVPVELDVTSLRSVEWESFGINFFLLAEPGVLEEAPHHRLAAARISSEGEDALQDRLATDYPNVTVLRVRSILERVMALLSRLALGVRVLGAFTVATGVVILAGAVSGTALRRAREAALLKTLGVRRRGVAAFFATEFGLVGALAGAIGGAAAFALAHLFLDHVLELEPELPLAALPLATLGAALLAILAGLAASARALAIRPLASLRD